MSDSDYNTPQKRKHPALLIGLALALVWLVLPGWLVRAAVLQQATATNTPSPTSSPTLTLTPGTLTASPTITQTLTVTPTLTSTAGTATLPPSPTATLPVITQTASPTVAGETASATPPDDSAPPADTTAATPSRTATLAPLPVVTYQFPQRTSTAVLLAREFPGDDISKGASFGQSVRSFAHRLSRFTPLLILGALWLGLTVWFLIAQFLIHRK